MSFRLKAFPQSEQTIGAPEANPHGFKIVELT
jgi:hypothetical protein